MKVLVVSISAPPKNAPESVQTGRYIHYLKEEHEITLLTNKVSGGWSPSDIGLSKFLERVKRLELGVLPYRLMVVLKRLLPSLFVPDDEADFTWRHRTAINKVKHKPDLIYSRSAPFSSAVLAKKLAKHWQCPWVMHLSDPWVDSPFSNSSTHRDTQLKLEQECFREASAITLTSQKTIDWYLQRYPMYASKFFLTPNVYDPETLNHSPRTTTEKFRVVFTGRLYGSRSLNVFISVLKEAVHRSSRLRNFMEVILAGFFDEANITAITAANIPVVKYQGPVSLDDAIALQRSAHMLLVIDSLEADARFDLFFPSKLLDYMAANRPIIALTRSSSTTFDVVHNKLGVCFDQDSLSNLGPYLDHCVEEFMAGRSAAFSIDSANLLPYSAETNAEKLSQLFKQVAG
jgi:glycosyltransferase involved in cell wall biosynthesis